MSQVQSRSLSAGGGQSDTWGGAWAGALPSPLQEASTLCDRGLFLQAFRRAESWAPIRSWRGGSRLLLAGRLARELGAPRLAWALELRAARAEPLFGPARLGAAEVLLERRSAIALWLRLRQEGSDHSTEPVDVQAGWLVLEGHVATQLRDFASAEGLLDQAEKLLPSAAAPLLARSRLREAEDRREEALALALAALGRGTTSPLALLQCADLLQSLGRGDEACEMLAAAAPQVESARIPLAVAFQLIEAERFQEGLLALDGFEARAPLLDGPGWRQLSALRSKALYRLGRLDEAQHQALRAGDPFHLKMAHQLAIPPEDARRVVLNVPFVAQDHKTCSPATLVSLAAYFGHALEQGKVAEEICYDGTPATRFREWVSSRGFWVRDFRVTWENARALLDRGLPFAVTTAWTMAAHHQALVGYDALRGTLLIRCPSNAALREHDAESFFPAYSWCGPVGTLLLPPDRVGDVDGLDLEDADLYTDLHALRTHLEGHRRYEAGWAERRLAARSPDHPLAHAAALTLAEYDEDLPGQAAALEALQHRFPWAPHLALRLVQIAFRQDPDPARGERMLIEARAANPQDTGLLAQQAHVLSHLPSERARVKALLRTLLRRRDWPSEALTLTSLANLAALEGRGADEYALRRLAAGLEDKQEFFAWRYFESSKGCGRQQEALAFLQRRARAYAAQSGDPVRTLVGALEAMGRRAESRAVLEEALRRRPQDAGLAAFAAGKMTDLGRFDRAEELLRRIRGRIRWECWYRACDRLAERRNERRSPVGAAAVSPRPPARRPKQKAAASWLRTPASALSSTERLALSVIIVSIVRVLIQFAF